MDLDLGLSSTAPMESFKPTEGAKALVESPINPAVIDEDNLPTPEELGKDLTENK